MADARIFQLGDSITLADVAHGLEDYFIRYKNMQAEGIFQEENTYFIQARQQKEWMKLVGMDKAVQVRLCVHQGNLTVDVGAGRWVDKLGAATVGYLIFSPLLITAAIGALGQEQLPRDIFDFVERFIILHGGPIPGTASAAPVFDPAGEDIPACTQPAAAPVYDRPDASAPACPGCGAPLPQGARFCLQCGQPVPAVRICPRCRAQLPDGSRFCCACGEALQ